jgi:hypothetical protein
MVKDESPPAQKGSPRNLDNLMQPANKELKMYEGMSDANKAASKSIQQFLLAIPPESCSQLLAQIGSDEFLKTFASVLSGAAGGVQVKFEHDPDMQLGADANRSEDKAYAAFVTAQSETSKERYECFKRKYAATNRFGNAKIPFQTFTSGFQVTSAPRLGDQSIAKVVLCKDDCVGILHLRGRRLMRRLFVPSSLKFRPAISVGFSPVIMKTAMTWPLMLSLPKLSSKGLISTLFSMIFCSSL